MNKEQIFNTIKDSLKTNTVTKSELVHFIDSLHGDVSHTSTEVMNRESNSDSDSTNSLVSKVLYTIGGIIAVSGILILLSNNWDNIGFIGRWLVTVGLGLATYISAFLIYKKPEMSVLTQVFFTISAITSFIGGFVWIGETSYFVISGEDKAIFISGALLVVFGSALYATRKKILHAISTFFFVVAYYAVVMKFLKGSGFDAYVVKDIVVYASMILSIGMLMYGSWIQKISASSFAKPVLHSIYTFISFSLFLFSALFLGGIWNLLYAFLVMGAVMLSIKMRSTAGLVVTSVAVAIYCIKISIKYFAFSLGFSFILVLSGLLIMALGYLTYYLNKKYISKTK